MDRHEPVIRPRSEHSISRRDIDPDALKVLYRLIRRGHVAYLVGGGVRDLLLGRKPKDFDISTDARPQELKKLFRNCFLIGRRFRLAHIKYGDKVIETSTFRCQPQSNGEEELLQTDDNTFGTAEEDAMRRDFTINGLFYDVETFSVLDYVGGLHDLDARVVRCIGDPVIRFKEDPVRMLRAIRFASRLDFSIHPDTFAALKECRQEISKASAPRLLEEIFRLYAYGSSAAAFRLLHETGFLEILMPEVDAFIRAGGEEERMLWEYLGALDRGDFVLPQASNALMFGALFLPVILQKSGKGDSAVTLRSLLEGYEAAAVPFLERINAPRRLRDRLMRIISMQHRFFTRGKKSFSKARFAGQEWFAEALALYEIHLTAGNKDFARADEWRALWEDMVNDTEGVTHEEPGEDGEAGEVVGQAGAQEKTGRRRNRRGGRRRNRRNRDSVHGAQGAGEAGGGASPAPGMHPAGLEDDSDDGFADFAGGDAPIGRQDVPAGADNVAAGHATAAGEGGVGSSERKKRRRRRKKKKNGASGGPDGAAAADGAPGAAGLDVSPVAKTGGTPHNQRRIEVADSTAEHDGGSDAQTPQADKPVSGFEVMKESRKEKFRNKKKKPRGRDRDKQILHDNRPSDAGPTYDAGSLAPHWLDEI